MRIAFALVLVGCVDTASPTETDIDPAVAAGAYLVRSDVTVTAEVLLPTAAASAVVTLRDFSAHPARTLFDLAEDAGVPAVHDLRAALPDYVEGKLEGWIDGEIAKLTIDGVPVTQVAGDTAALAQTALTRFAIDSELAIDGATATHTLLALDLAPAGIAQQIAIGALPAEVIAATATCSSERGALQIGAHGYALAYGEYIWRGIDAELLARYGAGARELVGAAVNCPALAASIASKCTLGYCVGHRAELTAICEAGVDELVERAHEKVAELRFDALELAAGAALLVDADRDGSAEALAAGVWTARINAGMGLRPAPATFSATR